MPAFFCVVTLVVESAGIELFVLVRAQNADLVIVATESSAAVVDWVNVKFRGARFARQFT